MKRELQLRIAILSVFVAALSMLPTNGWTEDQKNQSGYEILQAEPAEKIIHSLQTKSQFDDDYRRTSLEGPFAFTHPVNGMASKDGNVFWNLYEMTYGGQSEPASLTVRLPLGEGERKVQLGNAKYFLTKSQWITTGTPDPLADKIDFYKAYEVVDTTSLDREMPVTDSLGDQSRQVSKLAFVCLPAEEQHHEEQYPINYPKQALAIYLTDAQEFERSLTTIDQFGLHSLSVSGTKMLLFPCELAD